MSNMHPSALRNELSDVEKAMKAIPAERHATRKYRKLERKREGIQEKLKKAGVTVN